MKLKATKKAIKEKSWKLYSVGYCGVQYLFQYVNPFAYSAGLSGWACDYYDFNGVIISTGYSTIGNRIAYGISEKYEQAAQKIVLSNDAYETKKEQIDFLLKDFINEVTK